MGALTAVDTDSDASWVVNDGAVTNTDVIAYFLEATTGGASGVAQIAVTSDTAGEGNAAAVVTTGMPFRIGASGLSATPTFTGDLEVGQRSAMRPGENPQSGHTATEIQLHQNT